MKLGRFGDKTAASGTKEDVYTDSELAMKARTNARKQQSETLSKASDEFAKRQAANKEREIQRFRDIDADGSGELDLEEVKKGAVILGITEEDAEALFKEIDADGSGSISMEEVTHPFFQLVLKCDVFCRPDCSNSSWPSTRA